MPIICRYPGDPDRDLARALVHAADLLVHVQELVSAVAGATAGAQEVVEFAQGWPALGEVLTSEAAELTRWSRTLQDHLDMMEAVSR